MVRNKLSWVLVEGVRIKKDSVKLEVEMSRDGRGYVMDVMGEFVLEVFENCNMMQYRRMIVDLQGLYRASCDIFTDVKYEEYWFGFRKIMEVKIRLGKLDRLFLVD